MPKEYEKVNEPLVDKLERAAKSYDAGRISCEHPHQVAAQLRENADRIRKRHAERIKS
jgi:HAMP domain-containing protein